MGAWTSTFMIGISNRLYPPFLQLKDTSQSTYEESEGFEPPDLLQSIVFKTTSFDRSDNSPYIINIIRKSYISQSHVLESNQCIRFCRPSPNHSANLTYARPKGFEPLQTVLETVMLPLHQRRILTYQMNILSPYGPQPLSASLSFIGYHTVSPPMISLWEWRDSNPQCRRPQIYSLLSNRCSTLPNKKPLTCDQGPF